jgi:diadenosine tetraphosphate (Ap4A) HIT family hydrolase
MSFATPNDRPACPLCGPGTAADLLWEDARIRVIRVDDSPYPGYIRVIWRAHVAEMTDLSPGDRTRLMDTVWQVERLQRKWLDPDKINLASLGNQVPHLHWHLIPRWQADPCFPAAIWAPPTRDPAAWDAHRAALAPRVKSFHQALQAALAAGDGPHAPSLAR